jgi:hypothetical protein
MEESFLDVSRFDENVLELMNACPASDEPGTNPKQLSFDLAVPLAEAKVEPESVKVILRLKPLPQGEEPAIVMSDDGTTVRATAPPPLNSRKEYRDSRDYSFTKVLSQSVSQREMYESTSQEIVSAFVTNSKSGLIFAYGVTSSGKSYTVMGTKEDPGIIPRAIDDIYSMISDKVDRASRRLPLAR